MGITKIYKNKRIKISKLLFRKTLKLKGKRDLNKLNCEHSKLVKWNSINLYNTENLHSDNT
jgi:hypothetical protein